MVGSVAASRGHRQRCAGGERADVSARDRALRGRGDGALPHSTALPRASVPYACTTPTRQPSTSTRK